MEWVMESELEGDDGLTPEAHRQEAQTAASVSRGDTSGAAQSSTLPWIVIKRPDGNVSGSCPLNHLLALKIVSISREEGEPIIRFGIQLAERTIPKEEIACRNKYYTNADGRSYKTILAQLNQAIPRRANSVRGKILDSLNRTFARHFSDNGEMQHAALYAYDSGRGVPFQVQANYANLQYYYCSQDQCSFVDGIMRARADAIALFDRINATHGFFNDEGGFAYGCLLAGSEFSQCALADVDAYDIHESLVRHYSRWWAWDAPTVSRFDLVRAAAYFSSTGDAHGAQKILFGVTHLDVFDKPLFSLVDYRVEESFSRKYISYRRDRGRDVSNLTYPIQPYSRHTRAYFPVKRGVLIMTTPDRPDVEGELVHLKRHLASVENAYTVTYNPHQSWQPLHFQVSVFIRYFKIDFLGYTLTVDYEYVKVLTMTVTLARALYVSKMNDGGQRESITANLTGLSQPHQAYWDLANLYTGPFESAVLRSFLSLLGSLVYTLQLPAWAFDDLSTVSADGKLFDEQVWTWLQGVSSDASGCRVINFFRLLLTPIPMAISMVPVKRVFVNSYVLEACVCTDSEHEYRELRAGVYSYIIYAEFHFQNVVITTSEMNEAAYATIMADPLYSDLRQIASATTDAAQFFNQYMQLNSQYSYSISTSGRLSDPVVINVY